MIKIKIDEHTILPIEEEYDNEYGEKVYSVFQDTIISLPNKDIRIPKNTITLFTSPEDIIYNHLIQQRTITPIDASIIFYQVMKKFDVPFFIRLRRFILSLRNLW